MLIVTNLKLEKRRAFLTLKQVNNYILHISNSIYEKIILSLQKKLKKI